jgi:hypothetical protein
MRRIALGLVTLVLFAGCGKSSTSPSGDTVHSCGTGTATGSVTASINGTSFTATCLEVATFANSIVSLGATNVVQNNLSSFIDLTFAVHTNAVGTFAIGGSSNNTAALSIGGSQLWSIDLVSGGSGSVTFTTLSASEIAGTFTLNLNASVNATGTKSVTNGKFDVKF